MLCRFGIVVVAHMAHHVIRDHGDKIVNMAVFSCCNNVF